MTVCCVGGTWSWNSAWWQDGSPLFAYWAQFGVYPMRVDGRPFRWTGDLGGWKVWQRKQARLLEWEAAGDAFAFYLDSIQPQRRVAVAHSHGGQLPLFAAANGLVIDRLVTVATPVREDMADVIALARPNIRQWMHVCDSTSDRTAWWGAFGDRKFGNSREFRQADSVIKVGGIGHSGLVSDPTKFHHWQSLGLLSFLKGES